MNEFNVDALRGNSKVFDTIINSNTQEFTFAQLEKMGFSQDDIQALSKKFDGKETLTMADLKSAGYENQVAQIAIDTVSQKDISSIWNKSNPKGNINALPDMLAGKQEKI